MIDVMIGMRDGQGRIQTSECVLMILAAHAESTDLRIYSFQVGAEGAPSLQIFEGGPSAEERLRRERYYAKFLRKCMPGLIQSLC